MEDDEPIVSHTHSQMEPISMRNSLEFQSSNTKHVIHRWAQILEVTFVMANMSDPDEPKDNHKLAGMKILKNRTNGGKHSEGSK